MVEEYKYTLDVYRTDGTALGQRSLEPDWTPACEWTHFAGIREGRLPAVMAVTRAPGACRVEPIWHAQWGQPYVSAFRVVLAANGAGIVSREIPTTYLRSLAQQVAAEFVDQGILKTGEFFRYLVSAFAGSDTTGAAAPAGGGFTVEEIAQPLPLTANSLEAFFTGAQPAGDDVGSTADGRHASPDFPVFVRQTVIDEALELSRQAGDVETGGVLVGRLHQDPSVPEVFAEVTAQIAAPHTAAAATKLTFTPDTWATVRAALALRKRGELMVGWWHYHPDFCRLRNCPEEKRRVCTASSAFFSSEDIALHTALFARGYNTALLISDSAASGLTTSAFGWRQGMVKARGFYTVGPAAGANSMVRSPMGRCGRPSPTG
jgi:proteasome lid subunit RPN8/RPN11